jgi:transcription termination/antitermination protein NusG
MTMVSMTPDTRQTLHGNTLPDSKPRSGDWHVLWTRSHSEQLVHNQLADRGFQVFFPTIETWSRRRGMRHRTTVPMFPGYLFVCRRMDQQSYIEVSQTRGLVRILGESWDRLAVVPEPEIQAIRALHASRLPATPHSYLQTGQRVRIIGGLLAGIEGILLRTHPGKGLFVISVHLLQRSVAVEIDCTLVAPA